MHSSTFRVLSSGLFRATVARDGDVRVFDVQSALSASPQGNTMEFGHRSTLAKVFGCHLGRTGRICCEEASDAFLTVSGVCSDVYMYYRDNWFDIEDGTVRQHDLRQSHRCPDNCPPPIVRLPFYLSNISSSPITPYQFVVAGHSPCVSILLSLNVFSDSDTFDRVTSLIDDS